MKKLYYGDNLDVLRRYIKDETIDLCYIDPPFNSKRNYNQIYNNIGSEDKAQAQAFVDTWTWDNEAIKGFEEITTNYRCAFTKQSIELIIGLEKVLGKSDLLAYLISMTLRFAEIQRVLKPTGSFYLHCDPTASHYLKLILDGIFCAKGGDFINEIIWHYRRWTGASKSFQRMHDIVLLYAKTDNYTLNKIHIEATEGQKIKHAKGWDRNSVMIEGRRQPQLIVYDKNKVDMAINAGRINIKEYARVVEVNTGETIAPDVWDINFINSQAKERLGYPTQKPEALLERIIKASSNEGDVVLDAYCGCGTTIAVAERLHRNWIGIDITYQSISLIMKRLEDSFGKSALEEIELNGTPKDLAAAQALAHKKEDKTRKEFEKWAVLTYSNNRAIINEKKGADQGIDGIAYIMDRDVAGTKEENRQVLFSVKSDKSPHVSYIRDLYGTIEREKAAMGYFITLNPPTRDMVAECKKLGYYKNNLIDKEYPKIDIITVDEILNGQRMALPTNLAVLKSAQLKQSDKGQSKMEL